MNDLVPVPAEVSGASTLSGYLQAVHNMPVLTQEEERQLALRYNHDNDLEAARTLVLSQLRTVVHVARGFTGYGLPLGDLIQEGNIGLMKAVKHYDPMRGVRLVSFAVHWIRAEIYDYVLRNWRIVKVATTKAQRKLFFNLRKSRPRLGWMKPHEMEQLGRELDVPTETVREMEARLASTEVPFDAPGDDQEWSASPAGYLEDPRFNPERLVGEAENAANREEHLGSALAALDERSRDIVSRRWLTEEKPTLHELADEYGVSAERIRQIEKRAMEKLRTALEGEL